MVAVSLRTMLRAILLVLALWPGPTWADAPIAPANSADLGAIMARISALEATVVRSDASETEKLQIIERALTDLRISAEESNNIQISAANEQCAWCQIVSALANINIAFFTIVLGVSAFSQLIIAITERRERNNFMIKLPDKPNDEQVSKMKRMFGDDVFQRLAIFGKNKRGNYEFFLNKEGKLAVKRRRH